MRFPILCLCLFLFPNTSTAAWPDLSKPAAAQGGGDKDAALIVSIETYADVPHVEGADANGRDWYSYLARTRKIPTERIRWLRNREGAKELIQEEAKALADRVPEGGTLWFVFIGHGAPSKDGKDGVLVGYDAQQNARMLYARSLRQADLMDTLATGKQSRTVAVIDACFSGRAGEKALVPGLQPLIVSTPRAPRKTVLLSAGKSDEFAGPLPGAKRPAFSYLILGALRGWADNNLDGSVTATEAVEYSRSTLTTLLKGRSQTPQLTGDTDRALTALTNPESGPDLVAMVLRDPPKVVDPPDKSARIFPANERKGYMDSCLKGDNQHPGWSAYCTCSLSGLELDYTWAQFLEGYEEQKRTGEWPKGFHAVWQRCKTTHLQ